MIPILEVFTIYVLVEGFWFFLPAYAANGLVPIFRGKHPVDFNKKLNGKPIFGPGKTWEGLICGAIIGALIGAVEMLAFPYLPWELSQPVILNIVPMTPVLGFLLGFGAIIGDMCGSFVKRRVGFQRGKSAPVLDQDDFVVGSFIFGMVLISPEWSWLILFLIITPVFHLIACYIGYLLKVKREPW